MDSAALHIFKIYKKEHCPALRSWDRLRLTAYQSTNTMIMLECSRYAPNGAQMRPSFETTLDASQNSATQRIIRPAWMAPSRALRASQPRSVASKRTTKGESAPNTQVGWIQCAWTRVGNATNAANHSKETQHCIFICQLTSFRTWV